MKVEPSPQTTEIVTPRIISALGESEHLINQIWAEANTAYINSEKIDGEEKVEPTPIKDKGSSLYDAIVFLNEQLAEINRVLAAANNKMARAIG